MATRCLECKQWPFGEQVALHKTGQIAAQHSLRKSWEVLFSCSGHCYVPAEAVRIGLPHAVVASTAPWDLEMVPLTQAISRCLDVNVTSILCVMLLVKRRMEEGWARYLSGSGEPPPQKPSPTAAVVDSCSGNAS